MGKRVRHALGTHPLYGVWCTMKNRCQNPNNKSFPRYGGRGITVCEEWQTFMPFYEWAIASGYEPGLSVDRIDNDGNYEPANCRWSTAQEQANNRSSSRVIAAFGEEQTLADWARDSRAVVPVGAIIRRIDRYGWDAESAITTPNLGTGRGRKSHPELDSPDNQ